MEMIIWLYYMVYLWYMVLYGCIIIVIVFKVNFNYNNNDNYDNNKNVATSVQVLPSVSGQNAMRVPQNDFSRSLSILGGVSCLCIMFMSSVFFALIAMGIAILVYKYIELKG